MNARLHAMLLSTLFAAGVAAQQLPAGLQPALSGTRHEIAGYTVQVPGKGWVESKTPQGVIFAKRIDRTESYHAGLSVTAAPGFASQAEFSAFAATLANGEARNPRYKLVRNEHVASEVNGLWLIRGRIDFEDSGAVNVGQHGALATHNAHLIAVNPRKPQELIRVWFSWRGKTFDDAKFAAEAETFFASFRPAAPGAPPLR